MLEAAEHDLDVAVALMAALGVSDRLLAGSPTRKAELDTLGLTTSLNDVVAAVAE